jgi:hypothetical protein
VAEPLPQRGVQALRQLVDDMARRRAALHASPQTEGVANMPARSGRRDAAPLSAMPERDYFRATWARLQTTQQLERSLAQAPSQAGPLNSHRLALRALQQMRQLSPAYVQHFVAYVDALWWLDGAAQAQEKRAWRKPSP